MRHLMLLLLFLPSLTFAGEIYGKITSGTASVGEGTEVSATCGAKTYPAVKTDKSGGFHLVVAETGKCTLTVSRAGAAASLEVVSDDEGTQADIALADERRQTHGPAPLDPRRPTSRNTRISGTRWRSSCTRSAGC